MVFARRRVSGLAAAVSPESPVATAARACVETLELRRLMSAAADVTGLTALRADPDFAGVDGSGVGVAVIDSGTFAAHPDLRDNFVAYFDGVRDDADTPGSTNVDDAIDPDGHGTHTAGTVLSTDPEIGVATAADLVAIRGVPSAGDRTPQFDTVANSLQWVLNNYQRFNIKVVSISLADYETNFNSAGTKPQLLQELERLGMTLVIASGNNYANFAPELGASNPGIHGTLSVANTWADSGDGAEFPSLGGNGTRIRYIAGERDAAPDRLAATSQRSTLPNQVAAPGSNILSTWNDPDKLYNRLSGTSMATPFVSGMVALMQDAAFTYGGRYLTTEEVQQIVIGSADTITDADVGSNFRIPVAFDASGRPTRTGPDEDLPESGLQYKRIDVYAAVREVRRFVTGTAPDPSPTPPPDPEPIPTPTGDVNAVVSTAIELPSLNGTQAFVTEGDIGADGQVEAGANDVDLYKIVLDSPGQVTFATDGLQDGQPFDAYLRLFDAAGAELAAADDSGSLYPTLQSVRLPAGTYYFGISAFDNSAYDINTGAGAAGGASLGDYALTVSLENPDPNGVVQGATDVDLLNPDAINPTTERPANGFGGVIESDPDPLDPEGPRIEIGGADVDIFSVTAPDNGQLVIDVDAIDSAYPSDGVDSYVRVFDAAVTEVAANDDESAASRDSYLELDVTKGQVYYVAVTTFENRAFNPLDPFDRVGDVAAVGQYDLYLSFDNGDVDGTLFGANSVAIGTPRDGAVGSDAGAPLLGSNGGDKDVDFYAFTADAAGPARRGGRQPRRLARAGPGSMWRYSRPPATSSASPTPPAPTPPDRADRRG